MNDEINQNESSIVKGLFGDYLGISSYGNLAPYGFRNFESVKDEPQAKGKGFFGPIPTVQGDPMTELSSAFDVNGRTIQYPLIVPTLTAQEIDILSRGGEPTPEIYDKAERFALYRIQQGLSPFATPQDLRMPAPQTSPMYSDPFSNTIGSSIR